jgi:hypothetical protein
MYIYTYIYIYIYTQKYDSMDREKNAHQEYNHCDEKDTKIDPSNRLIKILKKIQFNLGTKKENTKKGGKTGDLPYPGPGGTGDPVPWNFSPLCDSQSQVFLKKLAKYLFSMILHIFVKTIYMYMYIFMSNDIACICKNYIYVYINVYTLHVYIYIYICICKCICIHTYTYIFMYI